VLDHQPLDIDAAGDGVLEIFRQHRAAVRKLTKQFGVLDAGRLDDLGHTIGEGFGRQGAQGIRIGDHPDRLPEGADQVFAFGNVHTGLAADRGIHLREQGGGDLDESHPAQPGRGRKAGHIAHHATAQRHQQVAAGKAAGCQPCVNLRDHLQPFVLFAGWKNKYVRCKSRLFERAHHRVRVQRPDVGIGHHQGAGGAAYFPAQRAGLAEQPASDVNLVRAGGMYVENGHLLSSPSWGDGWEDRPASCSRSRSACLHSRPFFSIVCSRSASPAASASR